MIEGRETAATRLRTQKPAADLGEAHLAARRRRERLDELESPRSAMGREPRLDERLQLRRDVVARLEARPESGSGRPTTPASMTASCASRALSTSGVRCRRCQAGDVTSTQGERPQGKRLAVVIRGRGRRSRPEAPCPGIARRSTAASRRHTGARVARAAPHRKGCPRGLARSGGSVPVTDRRL